MDPKLTLRSERLAELTTDELHAVAAAAPDAPKTFVLRECLHTFIGCTTAKTCPRAEQ